MEILTVEAGKGSAGVETGGERTLQEQKAVNTPPAIDPNAPPEPVTPDPTEAELEARREEVMASMWGGKPAAPAPAAAAPAAATPPAPAAPAAAAPAAPAVTPAPATTTVDEAIKKTAEAVGAEVSRVIAAKAEPQAAAEPQPEENALTPEDAKDFAIFQRMGQDDPALAGKAEEFRKFSLSRYAYEAKWLQDNPGRTFNPDDTEHEEFYKQQPDFPEDAYENAKISTMVDEKVEQRLKATLDPKLAAIESEKAMEKAMPTIVQQVNKQVYTIVEKVDPALAAMLKTGDAIDLSQANTDKVSEADPIASEVLQHLVLTEALPMLDALEKSLVPGHELRPDKNPMHRQIAGYVEKFEASLKSASESEQIRDGRRFLPIMERDSMIQKIESGKGSKQERQAAIEQLQQRYWSTTIDDIETAIVNDVSERAKKQIAQLDAIAQRKYKPAASRPVAQPAAAPTHIPAVIPSREKPPGVIGSSDAVDTTRPGVPNGKSQGEIAVETHWRK